MALDADEPVTLAEVKAFLRVDTTAEDTLIETLILAAREWVEGRTGLYLRYRELTDVFDNFDDVITLTRWPIEAASATVDYVDIDGDDQAFEDFVVQAGSRPATLILAEDASWPSVSTVGQAVTVTYHAGYGPYEEVPQPLRVAIMMLVLAWYDHRSGVTDKTLTEAPMHVEELVRRFRPIAVA